MIELLNTYAPVVSLLAGMLTSAYLARKRKATVTVTRIEATCTCEHPLSSHDPDTNRCHGTDRVKHYDRMGVHRGYDTVACTCRQYVGPKPIDQVFQPRVLPPTD